MEIKLSVKKLSDAEGMEDRMTQRPRIGMSFLVANYPFLVREKLL